jgi:hypothetical protein
MAAMGETENEFTQLSKEYRQSFSATGADAIPDGANSPRFQPYDNLFQNICDEVAIKLAAKKIRFKNKCPKGKILNGQSAKNILESESEGSEYLSEIQWESDTDSEMDEVIEELVAFRTDLEPLEHLTKEPLGIQKLIHDLIPENSNGEVEIVYEEESIADLEDRFHRELNKSAVLADFHEKYINHVLVQERENGPLHAHVKQADAHRIWKETVSENPLFALESISHTFTELEHISRNRNDIPVQETDRIKEIYTVDIELSERSRRFADFIPTITPRLNFD